MMTQQAGPLDSCGPDIADMLCEEIMKRKAFGLAKYGKPLRANNGRNALLDWLAELLDACHYVLQEYLERQALADKLDAMAADLLVISKRDNCPQSLGMAQAYRSAACMVRGNHPREDS